MKGKRIGILTSGGDSPGMNAAVRAIVKSSIFNGMIPYGIFHGYTGMINGEIKRLDKKHVSNIIQRGGTILKSARSKEFMTAEGRSKAYEQLKKHEIEAVIAIGGDGTFRGARQFASEYDIPFIGLPGTIDNDMYGTDYTIGFDTALNTVVEAVDKLRDTATSHDRLFFVEVMGRDAGYLAYECAIACGAEAVFVPEVNKPLEDLYKYLKKGINPEKSSNIILVAEGDNGGGAMKIADHVKHDFPQYDIRVTILGHIQRGGSPSAFDRCLATRMGIAAVEALLKGKHEVMIGVHNHSIVHIPFEQSVASEESVNKQIVELSEIFKIF